MSTCNVDSNGKVPSYANYDIDIKQFREFWSKASDTFVMVTGQLPSTCSLYIPFRVI